MRIETKFNIGDSAFLILSNHVHFGRVHSMKISVSNTGNIETILLVGTTTVINGQRTFERLAELQDTAFFHTKQALLNSL
mgnify:CR=1 FL=1